MGCGCGQPKQRQQKPAQQAKVVSAPTIPKTIISQPNNNQSVNPKTVMRMIDGRMVRVHST